jgi:signal transduction histidine kinase
VLSRIRDPIVRAVGRLPVTVHAKLLIAFVVPVVLLVVVGVLGLKVASESNARVEQLGTLQLRATAYNEIQTYAAQLRVLLGLRAGGTDLLLYAGGAPGATLSSATLVTIDNTISSTLKRFEPTTDVANLAFVPPAPEKAALDKIRQDFADFKDVMGQITDLDTAGTPEAGLKLQNDRAEPLSRELESLASGLVQGTIDATNALIAENRDSFADSERLFIAIALISIILAFGLGYLLSWSLIDPVRLTEARLAAIASGDFTGHVDIPNRDELGSLAANVNRMNDELGRLYQELETASRHKSEFLANMSHELRTPLNAVIGFSDVLSEQMFGELNAKQLEYLDDIRSSGRHLLALINDILDLSKVEAGRMELVLSQFSLPEVIESGMTMVRERAARQGIELTLKLDLQQEVIEADERKIKQVLFNLLSNAVKFTPSGGQVTVTARDDADNVEISVRDSGIGIDKEDQVRIFEAFQQAERGPALAQEGTGLGLGLAKRFVELHGGTIAVESEPGQGSTFTVRLPARRSLAEVA